MVKNPFRYFKTSPEIIQLGVMMYVRFPLSLRNVEDLLHERGIDVCHESVRLWVDRFGTYFAHRIRKRRSESMRRSPQWQWHLDEVFVKIRGERHYLWRAVDHEGEVLESHVTKKRDKAAALKFLKKAMKRYGNPRVVVTDRCPSYRAAMKVIGNEGASHVPVQADAKSAEVRLSSFVSVQSLQLRKAHQHQNPVQTETRHRASRVARPSCRIAPAAPRISETGSHSTDSTIVDANHIASV